MHEHLNKMVKSTAVQNSSHHRGSDGDFLVQDLESDSVEELGEINIVPQTGATRRSSHHHLVIREFPTWGTGTGPGTVAPKSGIMDKRAQDNLAYNNGNNRSHPNANLAAAFGSQQQNANSINSFLNQLGTLPGLKSDGDINSNNGGVASIKLGFDNPGLVMDHSDHVSLALHADAANSPPVHAHDPRPNSPRRRSSMTSNMSTLSQKESLFFHDGMRRIDMILVYEDDLDFVKEQRRKNFLRNLMAEGLEIETQNPEPTKRLNQDERTHFVKVHAPWPVVAKYAEIMNMKMPIKDKPTAESSSGDSWWKKFKTASYFDYNHERVPLEPSFFLANFNRQKEECFIIKDRETFFTTAQRSQIVWKILTRIRYDESIRDKGGIRRLLNDSTFQAAYPLHEGPYDQEDAGEEPNDRRLLYTEWAHFSNWYKKQPLWLVRRYFGDKVGLYFAWLGYYTGMLVPASIVGIVCFLFGVATIDTDYNAPSREICDKDVGGGIVMCPLCGHCQVWKLDDSCTFSKLTYFFDNPATVFFAVFMAFWATSFLEFWKRKHAVISWEWDLHAYEVIEDPRPEFEAAVKTFRINPVTQAPEPYLSFWSKAVRMLVVSSIVFLLLFIVGFVVMGIIIYRLVMMSVLYTTAENTSSIEFFKDNAKIIASVSAAVINLIIVVFLHNRVYYNVAIWLTNSEFPRTQTEYEDSFTFKMFLFQFINYYSYLIYIAFFKGRFFRHPGDDSDNIFEKIRGDMCDPAGCLSELFIQLSIIMIGKQFFNNFMELFMPKFSNWFRRLRYKTVVESRSNSPAFLTRWEHDYNLKQVDQLALFHEYLEMVIQYGFVTLFVAAFPLAPFFALLNNIVEIRLDAYKWITQLRRPLAERVEDIGAWYGILQGITYTSVVTNAFVIAYTSDIIPRLVYKYTNDDSSLKGYIDSSLSVYPTTRYKPDQRTFEGIEHEECRYRGYYNPPNDTDAMEPSDRYWHIMAARLAFVAVFEHLAFALTGLMAFAIPDIPREINVQIQREKALANETLYETDVAKLRREREGHGQQSTAGSRAEAEENSQQPSRQHTRRGSSLAQDFLTALSQVSSKHAEYNHRDLHSSQLQIRIQQTNEP